MNSYINHNFLCHAWQAVSDTTAPLDDDDNDNECSDTDLDDSNALDVDPTEALLLLGGNRSCMAPTTHMAPTHMAPTSSGISLARPPLVHLRAASACGLPRLPLAGLPLAPTASVLTTPWSGAAPDATTTATTATTATSVAVVGEGRVPASPSLEEPPLSPHLIRAATSHALPVVLFFLMIELA